MGPSLAVRSELRFARRERGPGTSRSQNKRIAFYGRSVPHIVSTIDCSGRWMNACIRVGVGGYEPGGRESDNLAVCGQVGRRRAQRGGGPERSGGHAAGRNDRLLKTKDTHGRIEQLPEY
jgi:hypothetical protein